MHPRQFIPVNLAVRRRLGGAIKADAVKNQWLLLVKNTPTGQIPAMLGQAVPRQLVILLFLLLFERTSLRALRYVWQHRRGLLASRRLVQQRAARGWSPPPGGGGGPALPRAPRPNPPKYRLRLRPAPVLEPLLSICMPTYHRPEMLARALRSLGPLPPDVEVLVSDNSTANDWCARVAWFGLRQQPAGQWRYYRNAPGSTAADNFAACARRARGYYLYHLHDDDFLRPDGLRRLAAELRAARGTHEVLLFGVDLVDANRNTTGRQHNAQRRWLTPQQALTQVLSNSSWVRIPALVASRAAYVATPPDLSQESTEDTDLWARMFSCWGVQLVPATVAAYTLHEGAVTASMFTEHNVALLLRIFARTKEQGLLPAGVLRRAQARFFHQFVLAGTYRSLRMRDFGAARRVLALLALPALRQLPVPLRWLPVRVAFTAITRLGSPGFGSEKPQEGHAGHPVAAPAA